MAATIVTADAGKTGTEASATTIAVTLTANVAINDYVVVGVGFHDARTISSAADNGPGLAWSVLYAGATAGSGNTHRSGLVGALATSALSIGQIITVTFSAATLVRTAGVVVVTGVDTADPVGTTTTTPTGAPVTATAPWASPSLTVEDGSAMVAANSNETANATSTADSPGVIAITIPIASAPTSCVVAYEENISAGANTVDGDWNSAVKWNCSAVEIRAGGAAAAVGNRMRRWQY